MKTHNLAVKVGEYQKDGQTKNRYQTIGAVLEGQHGPYILLEKTFNPAGIQDGKTSVMVSMFSVEDKKEEFGF